jgi:hypothetical protein
MMRSLIALALAAALPLSAHAADDGVSFTYVEADYVNADASGLDNMDGFGLKANVGFAESWYGTASWSKVSKGDVDLGYTDPVDVDFEQSTIGVGYHHAFAPRAHFLAELAYINDRLNIEIPSLGSGTDSAHGYRASVGIRGLLSPRFEGEAKLHYTDFSGDTDGGVGGEINAVFHVNSTWGVAAGWQRDDVGDDNVDQWKVGVRASF